MTIENGQKQKNLIQILFLIAMALFILIKDVTVPLIQGATGGGSSSTNAQVVERLARIEECTKRLENVPQNIATLTEITSQLKAEVMGLRLELHEHTSRLK